MSETPIRVVIVDDHSVVRSGLAAFLAIFDDLKLVGEAGGGQEAIRLCDQLEPDVVLMDLVMPQVDGPTATREIRRKHPQTQVVALTSFHDEERVRSVLQAGAISYLLKDVSADELRQAIRGAYAGRPTLAPEATAALIHAAVQPSQRDHDLTRREEDVLKQMVLGKSNPEIAEELFISRSTVKSHVSNILSKLEVTSRTEAVALAVKEKLVT